MTPRVIDISHHNTCTAESFVRAKEAGLWGVIHKVSQGATRRDTTYHTRRKWATDAGLLWGGYHFNEGDDFVRQADNFVRGIEADGETLCVLDYEHYKIGMTIGAGVRFMKIVEDKLGKSCALYSGDELKSNITKATAAEVKYLTSKRLWLAQYGPKAVLPKGFDRYFLWQYTGDGLGPQPHTISGFEDGVDLNVYDGSFEDLRTEWID